PTSSDNASLYPCAFFLTIPRPPPSPLFPYTTLFRSPAPDRDAHRPRPARLRSTGGRVVRPQDWQSALGQRVAVPGERTQEGWTRDRKSTRLNSSHVSISYAVFCLKKKKKTTITTHDL